MGSLREVVPRAKSDTDTRIEYHRRPKTSFRRQQSAVRGCGECFRKRGDRGMEVRALFDWSATARDFGASLRIDSSQVMKAREAC